MRETPSWMQSWSVVGLSVVMLAVPSVARAAAPGGAESPEALVAAAKATTSIEEMVPLIAPDDRAVLSVMMVAMTGMMIAFMGMGSEMAEGMADAVGGEAAAPDPEAEAAKQKVAAVQGRFEEILDRYGLDAATLEAAEPAGDDPARAARELLGDVDDVALLSDLMGLLDELGDEGGSEAVKVPRGDLTGLAVDGDRATGTIDGEEVAFVRVDGRWYLSLGPMGPEAPPAEP